MPTLSLIMKQFSGRNINKFPIDLSNSKPFYKILALLIRNHTIQASILEGKGEVLPKPSGFD